MTEVTIAKDCEGYRLELGHSNPSALAEHGPYELDVQNEDFTFITVEEGLHEQNITGCQSGNLRGIRAHEGDRTGMKFGRFGPCLVDADLDNPIGFIASLPPLCERPWPILRENESYSVGEQMVLTIAERAIVRQAISGMNQEAAIKIEARRIPPGLRKFLPKGATQVVPAKMAILRLQSEAV